MKSLKALPPRRRHRRRGDDVLVPSEGKAAVLLGANVLASAFDVFEDMSRGKHPIQALTRAIRKGKKRAKALADADRDEEP